MYIVRRKIIPNYGIYRYIPKAIKEWFVATRPVLETEDVTKVHDLMALIGTEGSTYYIQYWVYDTVTNELNIY